MYTRVPELADEGWGIASAEDAGLRTDVLTEMMNLVREVRMVIIFTVS